MTVEFPHQPLSPEWLLNEHQRGSFGITGFCGRHLPKPEQTPTVSRGECSRCGECCRWIIMPFAPGGDDFTHWYKEHGIVIDPAVGLMIPSKCQHLKEIRRGVFECEIYDDRPNLCRVEYMKGKTQTRGYVFSGCTKL